MSITTPWIINTGELEQHLKNNDVTIIDISSKDSYIKNHVPGAVFLEYSNIVKHLPPVFGLLPDASQLANILSALGIRPDSYLVVYDDEGGGKAGRLMWTLELTGHQKMSLLDGGIVSWRIENKVVTQQVPTLPPSNYSVAFTETDGLADANFILSRLKNPETIILDVRSANEFNGSDVRSRRGGHIPGAINIDWMRFKNASNQKLIERSELKTLLLQHGITSDKEIIVYCHSHHRSALCYVALKHLGYKKVRGYPASWSDWAARTDTPVEV